MMIRIPLPLPSLMFCLLLITAGGDLALAQNDQPLEENWAPGEWGAADLAGSVNRMSPETVLAAARLIKQGKVATLGKVYQADMPMFGNRSFSLSIPGLPTYDAMGPQMAVGNDELITAEFGQVGTQFDGPGHIGIQTSKGQFFYNGRFLQDTGVSAAGLGPLGVEHVAQAGFVCRGVLLDAVAYRGERLPIPEKGQDDPGIITDQDIRAMVSRQGIKPIGEGDCVFLYTGHGDIWHPTEWDNFDVAEKEKRVDAFNAGNPGFGISGCEYLASRKIMLWGGDTAATEAVRRDFGGENDQPFECHIRMMTRSGIWNIENLDLSQLVADHVYEFFFAWSPLKIKGATGSPGNPVAVY